MNLENLFLGFIGVSWPILWAVWNYQMEQKVKLSVIDFSLKNSFENKKINSVLINLKLFNYGEKPILLIEGSAKGHESIPFFINTADLLMPNTSLDVVYETVEFSSKIEKIIFYLADDRKFEIKGRILNFINDHLSQYKSDDVSNKPYSVEDIKRLKKLNKKK
jgi:hypothetical protein